MLYLALEMVSITSYVMVAYMKGDLMLERGVPEVHPLRGGLHGGHAVRPLAPVRPGGHDERTGHPRVPGRRAHRPEPLRDVRDLFLVLAGFGFKTATVPFHFWCPDVYQGAPTPVTAFLSVAPKAAGFAIMLRFFFRASPGPVPGIGTSSDRSNGARAHARLRRHDDPGEHRRPDPDEHEAPAGLLLDRPRRLHHDGGRRPFGERGARPAHLPVRLPLHEPGRLPGGHAHPQSGRHLRPARLSRACTDAPRS